MSLDPITCLLCLSGQHSLTLEDAKTLGIIGGLCVSTVALLLNFFSVMRSIKSQRISNYQEIIKAHRDLWKLSIDKPDLYQRVFIPAVDLVQNPITYQERLFARLLFLHMSSAYAFATFNHILQIEKLEMDFSEVLMVPIPRIVWAENRKYHNARFVRFLETANRPRGLRAMAMRITGRTACNYSKVWRVLLLSAFAADIKTIILQLGDDVVCVTDLAREITRAFIESEKIDCVICFGYGRLLREDVLRSTLCLNIHGGYLPYNRGPNPNLWAWLDDTPKGVSIHYIDGGVDTGDLIARRTIQITEPATLRSSFTQTVEECINLFAEEWPQIRSGSANRMKQVGKGTHHTMKSQNVLTELLDNGGLDMPIAEFCRQAHAILSGNGKKKRRIRRRPHRHR